jgi:hypothetical protein
MAARRRRAWGSSVMAVKAKRSRKWIQKAVKRMKRKGTLGSYGHHSVKQMDRDIKRGGKIGRKALFARNVRKAARNRKRGRKRS